jgi:hypothetical protein
MTFCLRSFNSWILEFSVWFFDLVICLSIVDVFSYFVGCLLMMHFCFDTL